MVAALIAPQLLRELVTPLTSLLPSMDEKAMAGAVGTEMDRRAR